MAQTSWLVTFMVSLSIAASASEIDPRIAPTDLRFFENRIRPLLIDHCYECHSTQTDEPGGGLILDTKSAWQRGGDSGVAVVPGNPQASRLITAVRYEDVSLQMPPDGKLANEQIGDLVRWIEIGAPDPRDTKSTDRIRTTESIDIEQRRRDHWSWHEREPVRPPSVEHTDWPKDDLDRFILSHLEKEGLRPAPPAGKRTLIRRLTFDLIGLPPTPKDVRDFLEDESPDARTRVVDRLLESPHFGEHWGQHWLDLVRFAETRGHEQDFPIPYAFRYRDYVIAAFNHDLPYNRLVVEHIAGDLIQPPRLHPTERSNLSIQGTGFWHLGEATHSPVDIRGDEADRVHNQIDVMTRTFLGLSVGCARCHDHKFDAVTQSDYYALFGYWQSASYQLADVADPARTRHVFEQLVDLHDANQRRIRQAFVKSARKRVDWLAEALPVALAGSRSIGANLAGGSTPETICGDDMDPIRQIVSNALDDPCSPLYALARIASTAKQKGVERKHVRPWKTRIDENEERVVEDFSSAAPDRWLVSGYRFGDGPRTRGEVLLHGRDGKYDIRFLDTTAAVSDCYSNRLSGILRTKTFEITGDKLWYRFQGTADVFLAVDSHRVVNGPLHGGVRQKLESKPGAWKWHGHDVGDYVGHRVHVEFDPKENFVLDRIQFSENQPPEYSAKFDFHDRPETNSSTETISAVADVVIRRLQLALDQLEEGNASRQAIELTNWIARRRDLFPSLLASGSPVHAIASRYFDERARLEDQLPKPILALALLDGNGENEPIHIRGNHQNRSESRVPRRFLTALGGNAGPNERMGSGRMELALQLSDPSNPLTARVMINRVWHHLFGRGIVETVDDFGVMGKKPTHPRLLDFLANRFVAENWSIKQAIRNIVLSSTYQMASRSSIEAERRDPTNQLWHRTNVRRLPAESIRDHLLAVSGRLNRRMFGRSVRAHISDFQRGNRSPRPSGPVDGNGRRSIYTEVRRNHLSAMLTAFDKPVPFMSIGRRTISNSPAQSLIMLNDPFVHQQAEHWADRLARLETKSDDERLQWAYESAFGRLPDAAELQAATSFLRRQRELHRDLDEAEPNQQAWIDLCHTLMNVKEFIYIN